MKIIGVDYEGGKCVAVDITTDGKDRIKFVPVKKAKWITIDNCNGSGVYCSNCYKKVYRIDYANQKARSRFCSNCGANMED